VTEMAVDKSDGANAKWPKELAWAFAAHRSFMSYVASVVEVEVNDKGEIRIPRVDTVVDAGTIVNPELVRLNLKALRCSERASR